jgi:hypothetical protein
MVGVPKERAVGSSRSSIEQQIFLKFDLVGQMSQDWI